MLKLAVDNHSKPYILNDNESNKEKDIIRIFKYMFIADGLGDVIGIPISKNDTVIYEMSFKYGRADIVVFHTDGSASVIEVKDGTKGYNHVVSGIGQAGLYAYQLAMNKNTLTKIRKCLLWTSTGDVMADTVICGVCKSANIIYMPWDKLSVHLDAEHNHHKGNGFFGGIHD